MPTDWNAVVLGLLQLWTLLSVHTAENDGCIQVACFLEIQKINQEKYHSSGANRPLCMQEVPMLSPLSSLAKKDETGWGNPVSDLL